MAVRGDNVRRGRQGRGERGGERRKQEIISESAKLFATKGFDATSMRDIAAAAGLNAGSLYYHFKSKDELFLAVHSAGVESAMEAVRKSLEGVTDPWERLEAAAAAHASALVESADLMILLVPKFPAGVSEFRDELIRQRDAYEQIIRDLVADLNLPSDIDQDVFRLHFIGALNWTQTWYRPNSRMTPEDIGQQLVRMLRCPRD